MNTVESLVSVAKQLANVGMSGTVFVGGGIVGLMLTDPAAPLPRQTLDVDVVVPVSTRRAYNDLELRLRASGHSQPPNSPICRWLIEGVIVDLMPPISSILGFSNRWYPDLVAHATEVTLNEGTTIRIASAPYLIASKIEAFLDRGKGDPRFSHDLTDIIIVLDGREELSQEIANAPTDVRTYISATFQQLLESPAFLEALSGHLPGDAASQARATIILERMNRMASQDTV